MNKRHILITNALTYANGSLHLGHMVGYIQSDIWARFQRMRDCEVSFIGGSDCHGTPIMLKSQKQGIEPEAMVTAIAAEQKLDLDDFQISLDGFDITHTETNRELSEMIFTRLQDSGVISRQTIEQAYDLEKNMFLPDRFVQGTCPRCGAENQYGDNCEVCGATYKPTDLKDAVSVLSGKPPVTKESEHYFFELPKFEKQLRQWIDAGHLQEQVAHKIDEWFKAGLQSWDISRDAPYFGFKIPGAEDKYFYVWLDAPVGYLSTFKETCEKRGIDFDDFIAPENPDSEMYHFVGKDIISFHAVFWPAMLMGANLKLPKSVFTHGFLTINGQKMSKSRGTFINARSYLKHLPVAALRYYLASKMNDHVEDMDINFNDFILKINSDLVGKVINIASRCAGFITKKFEGMLSATITDDALCKETMANANHIADFYERRLFSQATKEIMRLADAANQYINDKAPWVLAKDETTLPQVQEICSIGINLFRLLMIYLQPIIPDLAETACQFLNVDTFNWNDSEHLLLNHKINKFKPMMSRIEPEAVAATLSETA